MRVDVKRLAGWGVFSLLSVVSLAAASDLRLVEAVRHKNRDAVRALLTERVDVNSPQGDGATALHWAAHWDDLDTADLLLRAGANVNAANELGVTPLFLACLNRSAAMVEKLLAAGANPNVALSTGESALMTAARTGSVAAVTALLAHGALVNAKETSRGQTALMWAVAQQHPDIVRVLIEAGADVHVRTRVTRLLYNVGERNGARVDEGVTVIEFDNGGFTPLLFAARQGHVESARLLLAAGANVNELAPDGMSVLVTASYSGHAALVAFLLEKGADPNAADAGYTALHAAVLRGDVDLVKQLLAHGANPNARVTKPTRVTRYGQDFVLQVSLVGATPFLLAAKFAEVEIMRVLAAKGADPLVTMKDGTTALMLVAGLGSGGGGSDRRERHVYEKSPAEAEAEVRITVDAAKLVVDLGADVNAINETGDTALHAAVSKAFNPVIELLAERGARLDVRNKRGLTPLRLASSRTRFNASGDPQAESGTSTADLLRKLGAKE